MMKCGNIKYAYTSLDLLTIRLYGVPDGAPEGMSRSVLDEQTWWLGPEPLAHSVSVA